MVPDSRCPLCLRTLLKFQPRQISSSLQGSFFSTTCLLKDPTNAWPYLAWEHLLQQTQIELSVSGTLPLGLCPLSMLSLRGQAQSLLAGAGWLQGVSHHNHPQSKAGGDLMLCSIAVKCIWQKETTCKKLRWEELSVGNLNKLDSQNELEGFGRTQITFLNSYCKCKCYFIHPLELDHPGQPPGNHTQAVTFTAAEMGVNIVYILCNSKPIIKVIHLQINHPCYEAPSKRNKIRACELEIVCWVQILLPSLNTFKLLTRI